MRCLLVLPAVLILAACQSPSTIESSAHGHLFEILETDVMNLHHRNHRECLGVRLIGAQVVGKTQTATQELWTLEGCGRTFTYDVTLTSSYGGQAIVHEHVGQQ